MKKKILCLGLAAVVIGSTVACSGQTNSTDNTDTTDKNEVKVDQPKGDEPTIQSKYLQYSGNITEVLNSEGNLSVTVDAKDEGSMNDRIRFNISEDTLVLSDKTLDSIDAKELKEDVNVEAFYLAMGPMTHSMPPMTNARAIVIREAEQADRREVKIDTFDKDLISSDNSLRLNITDETVIIDEDGKNITKEDIVAKELIVFYGPMMTKSIPAQSNAAKIIVLETSK